MLSVAFGYVLEWVFISYLYEREHLQQVLMTYGLILVFEELRSLLAGDDVHGVAPPAWLAGSIPLGDLMTYPVYRLFMSACASSSRPCSVAVIARTRLGMAIRAGATQPRDGAVARHRHPLPVSRRVRGRRRARGARRA